VLQEESRGKKEKWTRCLYASCLFMRARRRKNGSPPTATGKKKTKKEMTVSVSLYTLSEGRKNLRGKGKG